MNTICLGGLVVGLVLAREIVRTFVATRFSGEERHRRRLTRIVDLEKRWAGA